MSVSPPVGDTSAGIDPEPIQGYLQLPLRPLTPDLEGVETKRLRSVEPASVLPR